MPILGISLFVSPLCATNPDMDVEEVSRKRAASDEIVRKDEILKKVKHTSKENVPMKSTQKHEMLIKVREETKKYNSFAQMTSSAEKKLEAYAYASKLCDQILAEMGEDVAAFDVRNAAIAHYNLAISLSDMKDKILSFSRSAYLFNELIDRIISHLFPTSEKGPLLTIKFLRTHLILI